jgi:carbohydrate-selective porin OprB
MPPVKYSPAEGPILKPEAVPSWTDGWRRLKQQLEERYGTSVGLVLDDHHQQVVDGPGQGEGANIFWWNLSVDQKLWEGGKLIFKARGSSQDSELPHGISPLVGSNLNLDWAAYETDYGYIANLYIEQKLFDKKLTVAAGKITFPSYFDENKVAGWDFFSHSLARNQLFPHRYHTIGTLLRYDPLNWLYVQLGTTDAAGVRSETGLNTTFDGDTRLITMGELGIKTKVAGWEGNYRFDLWEDSRTFTRFDGRGTERDIVGFGVSFDQMLTEKLGAFFRYGIDDGRVNKFSDYWSFGGTCKGPLNVRRDDVLGFGFGQGLASDDYREAKNASRTETILEGYYKMQLRQWVSLTLDCQVLLNPGTNSDNETAVIPGVRLKFVF